jgi:hypothetical protein
MYPINMVCFWYRVVNSLHKGEKCNNKNISNNNNNNKYQELADEICAMWKQNTAQDIPSVISSTAVIPKSLPQSLKRLNLHPNTYIQMQKCVILGTCSIVRNFLNYKRDHRAYCC